MISSEIISGTCVCDVDLLSHSRNCTLCNVLNVKTIDIASSTQMGMGFNMFDVNLINAMVTCEIILFQNYFSLRRCRD